jgi:hypothetical protein
MNLKPKKLEIDLEREHKKHQPYMQHLTTYVNNSNTDLLRTKQAMMDPPDIDADCQHRHYDDLDQ